jgi:hypothetical protein
VLVAVGQAAPAPGRVAYTTKYQELQNLEVADGVAFFRFADELRRVDLSTGEDQVLHTWPYDQSGTIWKVEAGGGRVGVEVGQPSDDIEGRVVSLPAAGGPLTTLAEDSPYDSECHHSVYLADVSAAGEVLVSETDCTPEGRYPGTLYAYGPTGRQVFGTSHVPDPHGLDLWDDIEVAGGRYLVRDATFVPDAPDHETVELVDAETGDARRLSTDGRVADIGLNAHGDAMLTDADEDRARVRLFLHDGGTKDILGARGASTQARLCGRWLAILEQRHVDPGRDLVQLSALDTVTLREHVVFTRRPERARLVREPTCAGDALAFVVWVKPNRTQIRLRSLAPQAGEPGMGGP